MRLSLKEALERREQDRSEDAGHLPSGIPIELVLRAAGAIEQPISLVRTLMAFGLGLSAAHDVVDRLTAGEKIPVTLILTPDGPSPFCLQGFGLTAEVPTQDEAIDLILRRRRAAA